MPIEGVVDPPHHPDGHPLGVWIFMAPGQFPPTGAMVLERGN